MTTDAVLGGLAAPTLVQPGQISAVYQQQRGAILAAALAPGATTVTVDEVDAFVDVGWLAAESADDVFVPADVVNGTPAYTDHPQTQGVKYVAVDRIANVLTLAVPWDAGFPSFAVGDSIWVDPPSIEIRADVALDGEFAQLVSARIGSALTQVIPQGLRVEGEGEWVDVGIDPSGSSYDVLDVIGEAPVFDPTVETDPAEQDVTFDSVTADVIESPSVAKRNPDNLTLYVSPLDPTSSDDNGGEALSPLVDDFNRTVAGPAMGTADSGHTWASILNQGNLQDVVAGTGAGSGARQRCNAPSLGNIQRSTFGGLDVEVLATINVNTSPGSGTAFGGIAARIVDNANMLQAGLSITSAGVLSLDTAARIGGTWQGTTSSTALGTFTNAALAAIDWRIRVQWQSNPEGGTDVRVKAWQVGSAEPDGWMAEINDASGGGVQSPFPVGLYNRTGGTQTSPFVIFQTRDFLAQVIGGDGLPVDVTQGGVGPLATIGAALDKVGEVNDGTVTILLGSGVIEEDVVLTGLTGGGSLTFDGAGSAILNGTFSAKGLAHYVTLRSLTIQDTGTPGPAGSVDVRNSSYVLLTGVAIQANGYRANGVFFSYGAHGRVDNSQINGANARGIYSNMASSVYCQDNLGGDATNSYQATAAVMFVSGSKPTAATNVTLGGQIFGTTSSNGGGTAPPPQPSKKTDTISANATHTWRPEWGWRTDNDEAYMGEYAGSGGLSRGCAFYGTKLRKSGKTADSGKVFIRRLSSGGSSGKQDVYLACHPETSQPGGQPNITLGPTRVGALAWGEGAWFTIPKAWVQSLMTGAARGLMVYHGSSSPYSIFAGRGNSGSNFQVKITYH